MIASRRVLASAGIAASTVLLLAATVAAAPATVAAPATAAARYTTTADPVTAAAGWLATQFVDSSHLPAPGGDHFDSKFGSSYFPNYGENADVLFGLAAVHSATPAIHTALGYLARTIDSYADLGGKQGGPFDGSVAKAALAAIVAGANPASFGGANLMARLRADECTAKSSTCAAPGQAANIFASISESFVILAEARVGGRYAPSANALGYFDSLQCASGGFTDGTTACGSGAADLDSTSYAIMALQATGGHDAEISKAVSWLHKQEAPAGYWVSQGGPNTNSTGLATAALAGQGIDVTASRHWLLAQQQHPGKPGAGALRYLGGFAPTTTSATSPSVLATAQGLTGLAIDGSLATLTASTTTTPIGLFAPEVTAAPGRAAQGDRTTVTGAGFVAGETVRAVLHSEPVILGTTAASPSGTVTLHVTLPHTASAGSHSVLLVGMTSGLSAGRAMSVVAVAAPTPSSASPTPTSTTPSSTSTSSAAVPHQTAPAAAPQLAATGQDRHRLDELALVAVTAIVVGGCMVALGRRREH